ncbi:CYTH domain-containing protein [Winogradskyella sp. A3E31]|uniref:CYTH domain-containing protein n=1 Tax=Winogradskyella sp. A3E31 TaxID=3349637 RepID=UPI00398ABCAD
MAIEIERKFLVTSNDFMAQAVRSYTIKQGFLNRDPERTVRIRLKDDEGILTIKGKSSENGLSRFEWETPLKKEDAEGLLLRCEKGIIDKKRYEIPVGKHIYEVDVFYGDNEGLILAEVELQTENESFEKPSWLGNEVTGDTKYYNSQLSKKPFKSW